MTEPGPPAEQERRPPWPLIAAAVIVVMAVAAVVIAQMGDEEEPAPSSTTPVETTASAPTTTEAPTTTPPVETTVTSVAPTTTTPATTTATTEAPAAGYPPEAIAVEGADLVRVDTATGASEVLHAFLFEAASGQKLALGSEGTAYLHFLEEDYWFTCESAAGRVEVVDVESGATRTLAAGRPALSPNGSTLAYLTNEECYPDPDEPEFFLSVYDTLVLADPAGDEISRIPLSAEPVESDDALVDLVWEDDTTLLVWTGSHTFYRVSTSATEPIDTRETVDLPAVDIFAIHDGRALAAAVQETTYGPIQLVSLADGTATGLDTGAGGVYSVGMSAAGLAIVSASDPSTLLIGIDLVTGEIASTLEAPWFAAIDW
ncbi:MAG TPA: hypothetical protein VK011_00680 [Acidimicrobiia bacterium]|nr:hypothetical protein [Acidimicrobiia bacterium]